MIPTNLRSKHRFAAGKRVVWPLSLKSAYKYGETSCHAPSHSRSTVLLRSTRTTRRQRYSAFQHRSAFLNLLIYLASFQTNLSQISLPLTKFGSFSRLNWILGQCYYSFDVSQCPMGCQLVHQKILQPSKLLCAISALSSLFINSHIKPMFIEQYEKNQMQRRFWMAQSTKSRTSPHLASMFSLASSTTRNSQRFPSRVRASEAARQGPALGVMPVLMPLHPSPNILLVFYQQKEANLEQLLLLQPMFSLSSMDQLEATVSTSSLSTIGRQQLYLFVWTTLRKMGFLIEKVHSLARSSAVEQLLVLDSPCGLAKLLLFISIFLATLFISFKYSPTNCSEYVSISLFTLLLISLKEGRQLSLQIFSINPPSSAMRCAASFPLGSIMPKYRSYKVYSAPTLSSAVVPVISQAVLEALTLTSLASIPSELTVSRMVMRFIILVRLAISRFLWLRCVQMGLFCCMSQTIQLLAVTLGGNSLKAASFLVSQEWLLRVYLVSGSFLLGSSEFCEALVCGLLASCGLSLPLAYRN